MPALDSSVKATAPTYRRPGWGSWAINFGLSALWVVLLLQTDILTQRYFANIYIQPELGLGLGGVLVAGFTLASFGPIINGPRRGTALIMLGTLVAGTAGIAAMVNSFGADQVPVFYVSLGYIAASLGAFIMAEAATIMRFLKAMLAPIDPKTNLADRWRKGQGWFVLFCVFLFAAMAGVIVIGFTSSFNPAAADMQSPYWPYGLCLAWGALVGALATMWGLIWAQPVAADKG